MKKNNLFVQAIGKFLLGAHAGKFMANLQEEIYRLRKGYWVRVIWNIRATGSFFIFPFRDIVTLPSLTEHPALFPLFRIVTAPWGILPVHSRVAGSSSPSGSAYMA